VKVSQGTALNGRKGYGVFASEVAVLIQVNASMKTLKPEFHVYRSMVLKYVNHYVNPLDDIVLVTRLVPHVGHDPRTMRSLVEQGCSPTQVCVLIIQVFMTLEVIAKCARGFVHMDLLLNQIFLRRWTEGPLTLRVDGKTTFRLPRQPFWPVIGDFGFAVTDKVKDAQFEPGQVHPVQDMYRFFHDLRVAAGHGPLVSLVDTIIDQVFDSPLHTFKLRRGYLTAAECRRLGLRLHSYIDVMAYSATLLRFT
jgi:hypothetical protein